MGRKIFKKMAKKELIIKELYVKVTLFVKNGELIVTVKKVDEAPKNWKHGIAKHLVKLAKNQILC